jgi:protein SCO1/2
MRPLLLTVAVLAACSKPVPIQRYSLHGEIVRLDAQGNIATIRHQKIEGWMDAMTMQFPIKDNRDFAGLHPSDCINATVFVQGYNIWVGEIVHQPTAPGFCVAPNPALSEEKDNSTKTP